MTPNEPTAPLPNDWRSDETAANAYIHQCQKCGVQFNGAPERKVCYLCHKDSVFSLLMEKPHGVMTPNERTHAERPSDVPYDGVSWHAGTAGACNVVTYNGEDVVGVMRIDDLYLRLQVMAAHNRVVAQLIRARELDAAKPAPTDSSTALAIDWARANAGEHADTIIEALAAYDPERVGARTVAKPAQGATFSEADAKALQSIAAKFTSSNSVPVERATITRAEWEAICAYVREGEAVLESTRSALEAAQAPERRAVTDEDVERIGSALYVYWNDVKDSVRDKYRAKVRAALESLAGVPAEQPAPDAVVVISPRMFRSRLFQMFLSQDFWHAHHVDLVWRFNGEDVREEADWLKDVWYALRHTSPQPSTSEPSAASEADARDAILRETDSLREHADISDDAGFGTLGSLFVRDHCDRIDAGGES